MNQAILNRIIATTFLTTVALVATKKEQVQFKTTHLVANASLYQPSFAVEENMVNAWGMAIRPAGKGGHFWVVAKDVSYEYVGDVQQSPEAKLRALHVDDLKYVRLPVGGAKQVGTGVVFSDSKSNFVITQKLAGGESITAPAKFLFASDGGIISAWTEQKIANGQVKRAHVAKTVINQSAAGAQFLGLAINATYKYLYAADFGVNPGIKVFDGNFKRLAMPFDLPFDDNQNHRIDPGEFAPFNIQALTTPMGEQHLFVTYAKTQPCPAAEVKKGSCKAGDFFAGEEDSSKPGYGRLAEFTETGQLIAKWNDNGNLNAPWGLAFAPANFSSLSNALLVANFGDGTIAAFDAKRRTFIDLLRDPQQQVIKIDKIWGLLFGNGESLGDAQALYFTAGPKDETAGLFGSLRLH